MSATTRLSHFIMLLGLAVFAAGLGATVVRAVQPDEVLADSVLEARARALSHGLRCLVCQNQSIDDSNAPLARDLRLLVRERLVAGDSDAQVNEFLVDRFGEFVLLKPPFKGSTLLLWLTPLVLLGGGIAFALRQLKLQSSTPKIAPLSVAEERALSDLLQAPDRRPAVPEIIERS